MPTTGSVSKFFRAKAQTSSESKSSSSLYHLPPSDHVLLRTDASKRKRSLDESPVDQTKMQIALQRLTSLDEELDGIEETEHNMNLVMKNIRAVLDMLEAQRNLCVDFPFSCVADLAQLTYLTLEN